MDIMDIRDILYVMDILDIMDIMGIMDIIDIMIITAWLAMAGAVLANVFFLLQNLIFSEHAMTRWILPFPGKPK